MDDFWPLYWDWKYPTTIIICLVAGFLAGYSEAKNRILRKRCKTPDKYKTKEGVKYKVLDKPVYLEDMGTNYDEQG